MIPEHLRHFFNASDLEPEIVEGDVERVIYSGEKIQAVIYIFPPNKVFPPHKHDHHEQMGVLFSGRMGFRVGADERILEPGDFYIAPIGVEHNAWTLDEPSVLFDFFSPVREDLVK